MPGPTLRSETRDINAPVDDLHTGAASWHGDGDAVHEAGLERPIVLGRTE